VALQRPMTRLKTVRDGRYALLRIAEPERAKLEKHLFRRYPDLEWGSFFRFGFRRTSWGLAMSFVDAIWPEPGDLDRQSSITTFNSAYSLCAFRTAERKEVAIGVIHSHPRGSRTFPSELDDDMDSYFAQELAAYSGGMPYCSLIFQRDGEAGFTFTGRVWDGEEWLPVREMLTVGDSLGAERAEDSEAVPAWATGDEDLEESVTARLASLFGAQAQQRLARAVIGVIGCSGTGSPAIHVLARAGVRRFVLIDPELLSRSYLERVHGSRWEDMGGSEPPWKVDVMERLIREINPDAEIVKLTVNALSERALDELLRCDLVLGCADTQHARVLLSDLATHYLLPSIDVGVLMEGDAGKVTTHLAEVTQYAPHLPCAFCGGRIDPRTLAAELMTDEERQRRIAAGEHAAARGGDARQYWAEKPPQFHTVCYLTTLLGSLLVGYAEGWLTGAFSMPHSCLQFDISQPRFGFVAVPRNSRPQCSCGQHVGWADQARAFRNIARPAHWPD
jgi:hypothetical protein